MQKPIIGITMGDPASIGPEIAIKALMNAKVHAICRPLLVGDAGVFNDIVQRLKLPVTIHAISGVSDATFIPGTVDVLDLKNVDLGKLQFGEISAMAGNASFEAVKKVIDLAMAGDIDATVTGPINKKSINEAGHHFAGHTEIYAHYTGTKKYAMLLVEENMRVIHVSTHVSLRQACDLGGAVEQPEDPHTRPAQDLARLRRTQGEPVRLPGPAVIPARGRTIHRVNVS